MRQRGNRGRAQRPWPGYGPFSHLPPWQRPGWLYGPGNCWSFYQRAISPSSDQQTLPSFPFQGLPESQSCANCGTPLDSTARFCFNCGAEIEKSVEKTK